MQNILADEGVVFFSVFKSLVFPDPSKTLLSRIQFSPRTYLCSCSGRRTSYLPKHVIFK